MGLFKIKKKKPVVWEEDKDFLSLYQAIKGRTLVTADRCFAIYQWAKYASRLNGDFAEVGVYKGGTAYLTARTVPGKDLYLFDTFQGMPSVEKNIDWHKEGDFKDTSLDSVKHFLKDCRHCQFLPGYFPDTAQPVAQRQFAYVHVDVDIYPSVKSCLEFFYPRMVQGGAMVFDDYEWKDCPGVRKALDEFLADKRERVVVSALYQAVLLKQ